MCGRWRRRLQWQWPETGGWEASLECCQKSRGVLTASEARSSLAWGLIAGSISAWLASMHHTLSSRPADRHTQHVCRDSTALALNAQADDPRYAVLTTGLLPPCSTLERATAQVVLDEGIWLRVASPCINDPKHRSGVSASQPAR